MFSCVMGREEHCKQISLTCMGSARSVWTALALPQLTAACAFRVFTALAPGCSAGHCPKQALCFMHFPGLSRSGSGSRVLLKGTDSVGRAFCALPGLTSSGDQVLGEHTVPGGPCVLITSLVLAARLPRYTVRAPSQVCHMSLLGS